MLAFSPIYSYKLMISYFFCLIDILSRKFKDAGRKTDPKAKSDKWRVIYSTNKNHDDYKEIPAAAETLKVVNDNMRDYAIKLVEEIDFNDEDKNKKIMLITSWHY